MRFPLSFAALLLFASVGSADYLLTITATERVLPVAKSIAVVKTGEPGPGTPKFKAVAEAMRLDDPIKLAAEGPYDVWWQPKNGIALRVATNVKLKDGEVQTIKLTDHLGVVNFRGDGQPRAALVTIAPQDDPGPDEKGHRPIQTAKDFRVDMVVPDGFYSLWVTPDNGARPRKVSDRFRVQAGKTVVLD